MDNGKENGTFLGVEGSGPYPKGRNSTNTDLVAQHRRRVLALQPRVLVVTKGPSLRFRQRLHGLFQGGSRSRV